MTSSVQTTDSDAGSRATSDESYSDCGTGRLVDLRVEAIVSEGLLQLQDSFENVRRRQPTEQAGYEPDYYDDADDMRKWLEHRDRLHRGRTGVSEPLSRSSSRLQPSISFRPYVDGDDADSLPQRPFTRPRRLRPFSLPASRAHRSDPDDEMWNSWYFRDAVARMERSRFELLQSFERNRKELQVTGNEHLPQGTWRGNRARRHMISEVKQKVADMRRHMEMQRRQQQQRQRDAQLSPLRTDEEQSQQDGPCKRALTGVPYRSSSSWSSCSWDEVAGPAGYVASSTPKRRSAPFVPVDSSSFDDYCGPEDTIDHHL